MTQIDNKIHNVLLKWLRSRHVKAFAIKLNDENKEIQVYTDKPGILIGKQGVYIENTQKEINQCHWYEDYKIVVIKVDTIISSDEFEISDEEYDRAWGDCIRSLNNEDNEIMI